MSKCCHVRSLHLKSLSAHSFAPALNCACANRHAHTQELKKQLYTGVKNAAMYVVYTWAIKKSSCYILHTVLYIVGIIPIRLILLWRMDYILMFSSWWVLNVCDCCSRSTLSITLSLMEVFTLLLSLLRVLSLIALAMIVFAVAGASLFHCPQTRTNHENQPGLSGNSRSIFNCTIIKYHWCDIHGKK